MEDILSLSGAAASPCSLSFPPPDPCPTPRRSQSLLNTSLFAWSSWLVQAQKDPVQPVLSPLLHRPCWWPKSQLKRACFKELKPQVHCLTLSASWVGCIPQSKWQRASFNPALLQELELSLRQELTWRRLQATASCS